MYNQSGLIGNINKDIFKMREYMIKNMIMKNNIDSNRFRTKFNKNSLLKDHKIYQLKKPTSPKQPLSRPIKTFLPIKTAAKSPTSNYNYSNVPSSPSVIVRPTSLNASNSYTNISLNNVKAAVDSGEKTYKTHQGYKNQYIDAKRRNSFNKGIKIEQQNEKFGNKLKRISSPLSRERLNDSYSKLKEYRSIAKKVDNKEENNQKKINYVKSYLPPLMSKTPNFNSNVNTHSIFLFNYFETIIFVISIL